MTERSLPRPIPFGRYKGMGMDSLPSDYIEGLLAFSWFPKKHPEFVEPIKAELAYRTEHNKHFYDEEYNKEHKEGSE